MSGEESCAPGEAAAAAGSGGRVHMLQPNRDLEVNWTVDLAKSLEDYLLKICSGEIDADGMEPGHLSVNFAEAAMLLQGSVQVYSRKVEYLYTLVLHALEFISQKRQDQQGNSSAQPDKAEDNMFVNGDNENFLGLDDVPVETKTCLDDEHKEYDSFKLFVKPPANLLVLEGDCLDTNVEASELESYLLSTCNFYEGFLLLDPCDAEAVYNFLRGKDNVKEYNADGRGSLVRSNTRSSFVSPSAGKSGGKSHKSTPGKKQDLNLNCILENNFASDACENSTSSRPYGEHDCPENDLCHGDEPDAGCPDIEDYTDDDDDDPWKPLNPHEPGNLRIKPFKKGKIFRRKVTSFNKHDSVALQFPLAKLEGTINPEFTAMLAKQLHAHASLRSSESPPLFEKLRQSLIGGDHEAYDGLGDFEDEGTEGDSDLPDPVQGDINLPQDTVDMDMEVPPHQKKQGDYNGQFNDSEACGKGDMDSQTSLEDLCRSHLDTLLASIAESEKQTELAARVSTWKQKIEHTLEDQDSRPPFDIQHYGERILDKLHAESDSEASMCFTDMVMGQAKHDIARTFSALLQLVNNGDVDLDKRQLKGESVCYTSTDPFFVRLRGLERRGEMQFRHLKKRVKSPLRKGCSNLDSSNSKLTSPVKFRHQNGKVSIKVGKGSAVRCTPESKRRRRSSLVEPVDLPSAR